MRLLLDQDVYAVTERFLRALDHDVVTAGGLGRSRATDDELLALAHADNRILVTRDRDFGALVFVQGSRSGVIYLRMRLEEVTAVHEELARVLSEHTEEELGGAFVVVEPERHRFRQI